MSKPNFPALAVKAAPPSSDPGGAAYWHGRALAAFNAKRWPATVALSRQGQIVAPGEASLYILEALACIHQLTADRRIAGRRVTLLDPMRAPGWRILGAFDHVAGRINRACENSRRALLLEPTDLLAARNYFHTLKHEGGWDAAVALGRRTCVMAPDDDDAAFDLGMLYLALERWAEGWPLYDRRLALRDARPRPDRFDLPYWDGTPAQDKHLLIWTDQNIGDEMQFARLLPEVMTRVGRLTLECDPRLVPLLARSFPTAVVAPRADPPFQVTDAGPHDMQLPQGNLGRLLRPNADAFNRGPHQWLMADPKQTAGLRKRYLGWSNGQPVIGIAWKSVNAKFKGKNAPLPLWGPVIQDTDALFLSVQYGPVDDDLRNAKVALGVTIAHDTEIDPMADLDAFACQLAAVDAVISISNSTIHQACGLGRPVMGLLHVRPDWRWGLTGDTSPWFPSLRLYRQQVRDDWTPVLERVGTDLRRWLAGGGGPW